MRTVRDLFADPAISKGCFSGCGDLAALLGDHGVMVGARLEDVSVMHWLLQPCDPAGLTLKTVQQVVLPSLHLRLQQQRRGEEATAAAKHVLLTLALLQPLRGMLLVQRLKDPYRCVGYLIESRSHCQYHLHTFNSRKALWNIT